MFFALRLSIILKIWEALSAKAYSETVWFSKPHSSMSLKVVNADWPIHEIGQQQTTIMCGVRLGFYIILETTTVVA